MTDEMRLEELASGPWRRDLAATAEANALEDVDALQEAQLIEVRLDSVRSRGALLFDLRGALQIEAANTALVVVRGLRSFAWSSEPRGRRTAWSVIGWNPVAASGLWSVVADFSPDATLSISGTGAGCYVGDIPGGDAPPPDYTEANEQEMRAGLPGWHSTFVSIGAGFIGTDT